MRARKSTKQLKKECELLRCPYLTGCKSRLGSTCNKQYGKKVPTIKVGEGADFAQLMQEKYKAS